LHDFLFSMQFLLLELFKLSDIARPEPNDAFSS